MISAYSGTRRAGKRRGCLATGEAPKSRWSQELPLAPDDARVTPASPVKDFGASPFETRQPLFASTGTELNNKSDLPKNTLAHVTVVLH